MKQYWQRIALKVDALTLRERAIIFALATVILITLVNELMLDPLFSQQKLLAEQIKQEQAKATEMRTQIQQKLRIQATDPDAANRELLTKLSNQSKKMHDELQVLQKGLVSPDKMSEVLESILKRNGKLRLISLKTLPSGNLADATHISDSNLTDKAATGAIPESKDNVSPPVAPVYKHGVEIVVQGAYLDMISYMVELEALPWQLFWGKAKLDVGEQSVASLTLTLYTLSLDKKWLNI